MQGDIGVVICFLGGESDIYVYFVVPSEWSIQ